VKKVYPVFFIFMFLLANCSTHSFNFDGEKAYQYLQQQCDLGARNPGSTGHNAAKELITKAVSPLADTVIFQEFESYVDSEKVTLKLRNIVAGFATQKGNPLLIGAHFDTRPRADRDPNPLNREFPIIGANDGASGVAVLLHLAELLKQNPPPRTVYLVFFDGEDYGFSGTLDYYCIGSEYFAKNLPIPKPVEAIIVDMIGDADLSIPVERNSYRSHPKLTKQLGDIAQKRGFDQFEHRLGEEIYDDHLMLIQYAGIPSVDLIDFEYPNKSTNYWHTTLDTPDKCSAKSLRVVGQVLCDYIYGENEE